MTVMDVMLDLPVYDLLVARCALVSRSGIDFLGKHNGEPPVLDTLTNLQPQSFFFFFDRQPSFGRHGSLKAMRRAVRAYSES